MSSVAIITGASSGIGLAIAERLAHANWSLVLVARDQVRLEATLATLVSNGCDRRRLVLLSADMRDPDTPDTAVLRAIERFGRLDAVINNAGATRLVPVGETTRELLEELFEVNVYGPAMLIARAWSSLINAARESGRATIVNVSSLSSTDPFPGFFVYGATKAAMDSLTRSASREGLPLGIRAFSVNPGAVETPMLRSLFDESALPAHRTLPPAVVAEIVVACIDGSNDELSGGAIAVPNPA